MTSIQDVRVFSFMRYSQVSRGSWFHDQGIRRNTWFGDIISGNTRIWTLMKVFGESLEDDSATCADFFKPQKPKDSMAQKAMSVIYCYTQIFHSLVAFICTQFAA